MTNQPPTIELLVGSIACGKSTWTQIRAHEGWLTINNDSLVRSMHGGRYAWNLQVPGLVELLAEQIITASAAASRSVVVDNTNRIRSQRATLINYARKVGMLVKIVVFPLESPEIHAQRRFQSDARGCSYGYWLEVARKIEADWEEPLPEEADEIVHLPCGWMEYLGSSCHPHSTHK